MMTSRNSRGSRSSALCKYSFWASAGSSLSGSSIGMMLAEAWEPFKSSYVCILYRVLRVLIVRDNPARQAIGSVQIREKDLFKAPRVFLPQSVGAPLAHILLERD